MGQSVCCCFPLLLFVGRIDSFREVLCEATSGAENKHSFVIWSGGKSGVSRPGLRMAHAVWRANCIIRAGKEKPAPVTFTGMSVTAGQLPDSPSHPAEKPFQTLLKFREPGTDFKKEKEGAGEIAQ